MDRPGVSATSAPLVPGANLTTHMVTVWQWGKTKVNRLLCKSKTDHLLDKAGIDHLPYEIVAMIIAHFTYNLDALKACSLTCRSWYTAAVPLLHHTLTLTGCGPQTNHTQLEMLSELHEFGLIPLVRQIRVEQSRGWGWFVPWALNDLHLCYFSAFTNVHTLRLQDLGIHNFIPGIERYFEHFSPTLRSIALSDPRCTPQQLSHFLSLFTNLDNIEIQNTYTYIPDKSIPDTELVPFSVPKLRGWLLLGDVSWAETWTNLITLCGSLRFRYMDLRWSGSCTPTLLEACAETLETVRFDTTDRVRPLSFPNLSGLKVLRSLQAEEWLVNLRLGVHRDTLVRDVFSTITSPVFSELVIVLDTDSAFRIPLVIVLCEGLRELNEIRPFKLVFSFEGPHSSPEEARCVLARCLRSATARGLLDFLDSPPTIRIARPRRLGWDPVDLD